MTHRRFSYWVPLGGLILALGYLPTLAAPFDFIDDGNLVYPAPAGTTVGGHVRLWWEKVVANYEHLGPVRPVLWAHWELFANLTDGRPVPWRIIRWTFCLASAVTFLWFLKELGIRPVAALIAGAAAFLNPYRNEIWPSLTLAEGVAMPYAMLALIAARKAGRSNSPARWDALAIGMTAACLGCKNTYAALVPAQIVLRLFPDGLSLRQGFSENRLRAAVLGLPLLLPVAHLIYFQLHWHPGQYEPGRPTTDQLWRILNAMKGAVGLDFLGVGLASAAACVWANRRACEAPGRSSVVVAGVLFLGGVAVYLPMRMMSGRYTMPGVWGLDVAVGLLLSMLSTVPRSRFSRLAWAGVWVGILVLAVACMGRQDKLAARSKMLWQVVEFLETHAPQGAVVAWVAGDSSAGELNVEEGIHVRWHLLHRGRGDVRVQLTDRTGRPVERVELGPVPGEPVFHIWGTPSGAAGRGEPATTLSTPYWVGRKKFECHIGRPADRRAHVEPPRGAISRPE